jgi:hypothetical protein
MVFAHHVLHVPQPVVDESEALVAQRRLHAAAAVMAADDDVFDIEHVDGVLQHRQTVEIGMHHDVRHVAMHEEFTRVETDDFIGGDPAVGAADPEIVG